MLIAFSRARDTTMKIYNQLTYEQRCLIYTLNKTGLSQNKIAKQLSVSQSTGLQLQIYTDQSTIQLYTGNALLGEMGRESTAYDAYYGLCLETQHYSDQVNMPEFAQACIYSPNRPYSHKTVLKIAVN